jgi:hypothetical protein
LTPATPLTLRETEVIDMDHHDWVVELRLFEVQPAMIDEFHRISRDGTVPLMRRHGITVLAFGPCLGNDDEYFLMRAFRSEQHRIDAAEQFYASPEWLEKYDHVVPPMISSYRTVLLPASAGHLSRVLEMV